MSDTNVVVLTGTLGDEVKSRAFPDSGNIEAVIRLASNKYKANPQAETGFDQYTTWTTVKFRGRVAENAVKKLSKGLKITVVGALSEDVWEDRNTGKMQRQLYISAKSFEAKQAARRAIFLSIAARFVLKAGATRLGNSEHRSGHRSQANRFKRITRVNVRSVTTAELTRRYYPCG